MGDQQQPQPTSQQPQPACDPSVYSWAWFKQKVVEAVMVAASLFILQVCGLGVMQAYLLPERLEREAEKMQRKFDERLRGERDLAVGREAELMAELERLKREHSRALSEAMDLARASGPRQPVPPPFPGLPEPGPPNPDQHPTAANWKNIGEQRQADPEKSKLQWIQRHGGKQ